MDFRLEILLLIPQRAHLYLDGFALVALVKLNPARRRRGFAFAEIFQVHELFIYVVDLRLKLLDLIANGSGILRVRRLGRRRRRFAFWIADHGDRAFRAGNVVIGPDFLGLWRVSRRCGILRLRRWRWRTGIRRLRGGRNGCEKGENQSEGERTGHAASSISSSRTLFS